MNTKIPTLGLTIAICFIFSTVTAAPPITLQKGMIIKTSVQIKKDRYLINGGDSLKSPVIIIEGNNITVDFNNALLQGSNNKIYPNEFYGQAILVKGNNITIKNARVAGYKVALIANGCKNLKIEYCDFSYNYRQQLQSTWLSEDVSDWMSYHHNENDEWLRYGAGIYLKDCSNATIQHNTITGGQCALMMMRCNDGMVNDNDFSFNSGIGIGMYRSSGNKILHNKLDFNVRGYSHGIYNRGQDSAGILVFEQCNENIFAFNSVTHGGDGFFLWAGQTTMDSGEGGCNNNVLYKNDFSYAPTNGVEVTFSKNIISTNRILECDNGIWGGYSFSSTVLNNIFKNNNTAIAIEHGHNNNILMNWFDSNKTSIKLWAKKEEPSDWGFPKYNNTSSRIYDITNNRFNNAQKHLDIKNTDSIFINGNFFKKEEEAYFHDSTNNKIHRLGNSILKPTFAETDIINYDVMIYIDKAQLKKLKIENQFPDELMPGRKNIHITEWGPYDFHYPILFLKKIDSNNIYHFDVLGPAGKWKIKNTNDVTGITTTSGIFPAEITAQKTGEDVQIEMEYTGPAFKDQFGKMQTATNPYPFTFRDYKPTINWSVNWFSWDAAHNPNKDYKVFKDFITTSTPVKTENAKQINYTWWGAIGKQLPADSFATVATGTIEVKKGKYRIGVTADDLVKVFIDGKLVIDFWDAAKYVNDEDAHHSAIVSLNGKHEIRIEQVENSGYATLIFSLKPL
ncbi:right-handed parallel beta-helix repeat-containing protein [Ferruginibacter sp. SUN106]|uniref:right-handed parallel beta-helix repeat-containing protein n=1 Tax=Ferruginibacter sp. SUN106 TaxID=2978348 RepID=UPI003D3637DB